MRRSGLEVLVVVAALLVPAVPVILAVPADAQVTAGAGPAAKIPPLVAFGDAQEILPHIALGTALSGLPSCTRGKPEREPTFARALADAQRMFKGAAAGGEKTLAAARYSGTPGRADVFAAAAAGDRAPAAALAALLDARRRAPKNAMVVANAAAMLLELGRPADALAFDDKAARLGPVKGAPLGISNKAVELNNRGFALLSMRNYAAAVTTLKAAVRAGGRLLSEASINEAQALNCTGKREQAFHALLAGAYRQAYDLLDFPGGPQEPPPGELGFTHPTGPPDTLPSLKYPTTNAQAQAASQGFNVLTTFLLDQVNSLNKQVGTQEVQLFTKLRNGFPLTRLRTEAILTMIGQAGPPEPALVKTSDAAARAQVAIDDFQSQYTGQDPPSPCAHHGQWLSLIQNWDTAIRNYVTAISKYEAPLVASLASPVAHEIALESIRISDDLLLTLLTNEVTNWSDIEGVASCSNPKPMSPPADKGAGAGDPGECPFSLGPELKLVIKLPVWHIKINCESVETTIEGEGLIAPFGTIEHKFGGETTIVAGVKAGQELGPFGGAEVDTGFYVKFGPNGPTDVGIRINPSASTGPEGVLVEYGTSVDFSIVESVTYIPTAFGFQ